jgi:hypothetical protein
VTAAIEAQFLMGHCAPHPQWDADGKHVTDWVWSEDTVRQALYAPLNNTWGQRVLELELHGLARFHADRPPVMRHTDGTPKAFPSWQDVPRDAYGWVLIGARGILKLAALYGRPYVRYGESPALSAHWELVLAEFETQCKDGATWEREYPEQARARDAWERQMYTRMYDMDDDGRG